MHTYATNSRERAQVNAVLALLAIASAWATWTILRRQGVETPWWIDAPSTMAWFGLFRTGFDRWVWRWGLARRLGIVDIPVLAGRWHGHVTTSFDKHAEQHEVSLEIRQTWTCIVVRLESPFSRSVSMVGAVLTEDNPEGEQLIYLYRNEPVPTAGESLQAHQGTARLYYDRASQRLEGDYYSGRGRSNVGTLTLTRRE